MQFRDLKRQYTILKDQIDDAIMSTVSSGNYISGPEIKELEKQLSEYVGVKHCITCANGTDALTISLRAFGIGKGDAVFVPDFTFFATAESVADEGATPIFVDIDKRTYNLDPDKLEEAIAGVNQNKKHKAKAVIAVDLFGLPANYERIKTICRKNNLLLLEDGAQGFGGSINGKMACGFGDISTTSFFPAKPLGCYGDGGAIFTDNDKWANIIRSLCVHGKDTRNPNDPNAKYNNIRIGKNSRLDTLQAAILLKKFDAFRNYELKNINQIANWYTEGLKDTELILPFIEEGFYSSWAQYTIQLDNCEKRKHIQSSLKEMNIPTMVYYTKPLHMLTAFDNLDIVNNNCHITEQICSKVLSLPIYPYMRKDEVDYVVMNIKKVL